MSTNHTTIYLADDHQIVIDGLKLLIEHEPGLKIVGSAINGDTACQEILTKRPDIALIDHRMPGMTGIDLINSLRKLIPTRFIILSMHAEKNLITDAMNYGAAGYLLKNTGKYELLECISKVAAGGTYLSKALQTRKPEEPATFTRRELEILRMIVINEWTTLQIAEELSLSVNTVDTHRKNICRKANTKTPIGLANYVRDNRIEL